MVKRRGALAAAVLGFFVVRLDATVVNVTLPSVRADFISGISGLQRVVDGCTLMFAALLLPAGVLLDRIVGRRAFGAGVLGFVAASATCGFAPSLGMLVGTLLASRAGFLAGLRTSLLIAAAVALIAAAVALTAAAGSILLQQPLTPAKENRDE